MKKYKGKILTIKDFLHIIPWEDIENKLGKRHYKAFAKYMSGQTATMSGVYPCDLEDFLNDRPNLD